MIIPYVKILIMILTLSFLISCAPYYSEDQKWIYSLETLPQVEGFSMAGIFSINGKIYVQKCDIGGNQIWMRYNEETHTWRQSRYNTLGCLDSNYATGPNKG